MSAIVCATAVAACGGGDDQSEGGIPEPTADGIVNKLEVLESQFDNGECEDAEASAAAIQTAIGSLGSKVQGELEETLVEASGNLVQLVREECEDPPPPPEPEPGATGEEGVVEG